MVKWGMGLAASVLFFLCFYHYKNISQPEQKLLSFQTTYGETKRILLPDSSTVLLNANSSISWSTQWKQVGKREVNLKGEAFFDVRKMNGMQFVVQSGGMKVKVLGTVFNVRNRGR